MIKQNLSPHFISARISSAHRSSHRLPTRANPHSLSVAYSSSSSSNSFNFPRSPSPTPFEIFHLPPSASTNQIKERYYQLVKIYHPDVASNNNSSSSSIKEDEITRRFKLIREAYELLSSPSRRQRYIRFREGWGNSRPQTPNRSWRNNDSSTRWTNQSAYSDPYLNLSSVWRQFMSRHRSARAGFYSSGDDDQAHNWFNNYHRQDSSYTFKQQWERDGLFAKNGIFITSVGCFSLFLYLLQLWRVLPLVGSDNRTEIASDKEHSKFRKFIEPAGDERLDREAWARLHSMPFTNTDPNSRLSQTTNSPAPLLISSLQTPSQASEQQPNHRFYSSSFQDRIQKQNLKAVSDLKSARAAAVKPSVFSSRISPTPSSTNTS